MSNNLLNALKGKVFKEGTYTLQRQYLDKVLHEGRSLVLFNENMESLLTSGIQYWEIQDDKSSGIVVTRNSAYHVVFN